MNKKLRRRDGQRSSVVVMSDVKPSGFVAPGWLMLVREEFI